MPPRRSTVFALALVALVLAGTPSRAEEGTGHRELAQGREAAARQDHVAALKHFKAALSALDPAADRETLADTWLQFGLTLLNGLDLPEAALPAFVTSAGLAQAPSTAWLWASVAAEKSGRAEEAATYKTRALARPAPAPAPAPEPAPVPEPTVEETTGEKPDAVQHFFGEAAAQPEPEPVPEEPAAPAAQPEAPAAPDKPKETVDAVQYFFGEKEPAAETAPETSTEEKPPAEM